MRAARAGLAALVGDPSNQFRLVRSDMYGVPRMASLRRFPQRAGVALVTRRELLAPRMLRLTLNAPDFGDDWPIEQPGEILTLCFVTPDEPVLLPLEGWRFPPHAPEQPWRNYTVRAHRPDRAEIDVDVVLHEPRGPACTVAAACEPGWSVGYAGPRVDFAHEPDADWLLLAGDETALPAIAAILEQAPPALPVTALVEIDGPRDAFAVQVGARQELVWVHRDGQPAGVSRALVDAVRALALPDGVGQAWGAAESRVARDLRGALRDEHGMPRSHARARGYWLRTGDWLDDEE